jgi:hypothetical protein
MQNRGAVRDEQSGLKIFTLYSIDATGLVANDGSEKRYLVLNELELAEQFPAARETFAQGLQTVTMEVDPNRLVISPKNRSIEWGNLTPIDQ